MPVHDVIIIKKRAYGGLGRVFFLGLSGGRRSGGLCFGVDIDKVGTDGDGVSNFRVPLGNDTGVLGKDVHSDLVRLDPSDNVVRVDEFADV
jgi:hypothetical protein